MQFCIENEDGSFKEVIHTIGNIEWDANHFCPVAALTEDERAMFRVVPYTAMPPPAVDIAHKYQPGAPVKVNGAWVQQWNIVALSESELAAAQAAQALRIQQEIVDATQRRLDDFARTRNYDGILSACTYSSSSVPKFAAEGQYCVDARDQTWAALYTMLGEVQAGTRPIPSGFSDVEPLLPALVWPA